MGRDLQWVSRQRAAFGPTEFQVPSGLPAPKRGIILKKVWRKYGAQAATCWNNGPQKVDKTQNARSGFGWCSAGYTAESVILMRIWMDGEWSRRSDLNR